MALRDPVAAYNALDNIEAQVLCNYLGEAGIEAYPTEDVSFVGTWGGGIIPEIFKPQVWVDRSDLDRVQPFLIEYERRVRHDRGDHPVGDQPMNSVCDDCGESATFAGDLAGTVQTCPHCGSFMDVVGAGGPGDDFDWEESKEREEEEPSP